MTARFIATKSTPLEVLQHYWGHSSFRDTQLDIINSVLDGHNTMGLLPTGGGKVFVFKCLGLFLRGLHSLLLLLYL